MIGILAEAATQDTALTVTLVGVVVVLARVIERLVTSRKNGKSGKKDRTEPSMADMARDLEIIKEKMIGLSGLMKDLHRMHTKTNADGTPIWYFPPAQLELMSRLLDTNIDVSTGMQQILSFLEREQKRQSGEFNSNP